MKWWKRLGGAALALVYPARCTACDADCDEGAAFCALCADTLEPIVACCERCGLPLAGPPSTEASSRAPPSTDASSRAPPSSEPSSRTPPSSDAPSRAWCIGCLERPPPFASARAPFQFGGAIARAIRRMKLGDMPELARPLAALLSGSFAPSGDLVVPVPLHPRRLRAREFNQAALLALDSRRATGPPVRVDALERVRDTPSQSTLGAVERRANVQGAFRARAERVRGRRILLVDDVMTTGATAEACTRALLDGGAAEVRVLTVARAVP